MGEKMIIEYRNNWCSHEYTVNGKPVEPKRVRVRTLGTLYIEYPVVPKGEYGTYDDMGRTCRYSTTQYYIQLETPVGVFSKSLMELIRDGKVVELVES